MLSKATIANTLRRSQRTARLMHVLSCELKHKISPMCLVGYWKHFVIRLSFEKTNYPDCVVSIWTQKYRGKTLVFRIFAKLWWKIKSLSTVGHLLYKDLTPPKRCLCGRLFLFSVDLVRLHCLIVCEIADSEKSCKEGRKKEHQDRKSGWENK